jgi:DNA-binding MarR family transcriptional regulator
MPKRQPDRLPPLGTRNVLFQSFRTVHALRALMGEAVAGTGISGDEYGVLGVVHFFPEQTPTELAQSLGIPPTTVSRYVNRFVEEGLVERVPNATDGRSHLLRATDRGRRLVKTIAPRVGALVDALEPATDIPLEDITRALVALEDGAKRVLDDRAVATTR